eukprot:TRINITY_DN75296_c0_g1_i1.p3 TRINITY_DN75296_c0_g1~~TRINITY_DN75296_c0_g1_i1.p3  ORF type:complete len:122 (+),score=7.63 TRINITY_DN75296_c0_g1_i1:2-367(+)
MGCRCHSRERVACLGQLSKLQGGKAGGGNVSLWYMQLQEIYSRIQAYVDMHGMQVSQQRAGSLFGVVKQIARGKSGWGQRFVVVYVVVRDLQQDLGIRGYAWDVGVIVKTGQLVWWVREVD